MALELTFVNQYGNSAPKRRRLAKACESCRSRKVSFSTNVVHNLADRIIQKRCMHFTTLGGRKEANAGEDDDSDKDANESPIRSERSAPACKGDQTASPAAEKQRVFISDMNPGTALLHHSRPTPAESRQPSDVGIWVDRREWDALRQKNSTSHEHEPTTEIECQRPHATAIAPLIDIYFRRVHPVLPILEEDDFRNDHAAGKVSDALVHAICLVAAKDAEAASHLRIAEGSTILAAREFCSKVHASVVDALRWPRRFDRITLIRTLALASLHAEGQDGGEEAALFLTQAMHYTQTMGWHLGQHCHVGQQAGPASSGELTTKRLFWCLWSLDRLNSCIYGRPCMMADIDIAIEQFVAGESGYPAFEIWLFLCKTLNKLISYYRPGTPVDVTGWQEGFPSFEDAVKEARGWRVPQDILATLHLFYLLVAVLSHRSRGVKHIQRATPSYVRQSLCAIEIHRLMGSDMFASILPLPLLPYAISLALSVSYQHLRQSQLRHQQEDARSDFRSCYQVLQKLRRTWSSADLIAIIAKKVLDELNKSTDLSNFRIGRLAEASANSPGICAASLARPDTLIDGRTSNVSAETDAVLTDIPNGIEQPANGVDDGLDLFEGMDDVFDTFLDAGAGYPVHLDDFSFLEDLSPFEWSTIQA